MVGYAVRRLWRREYSLHALGAIILIVLVGRIVIVGKVLVAPELLALVLCIPVSAALVAMPDRRRAGLLALLLASVIALQGLKPFEFLAEPHSFSWVPFMNSLSDSLEVNYSVLLEKCFWYFSLVWLLTRWGMAVALATGPDSDSARADRSDPALVARAFGRDHRSAACSRSGHPARAAGRVEHHSHCRAALTRAAHDSAPIRTALVRELADVPPRIPVQTFAAGERGAIMAAASTLALTGRYCANLPSRSGLISGRIPIMASSAGAEFGAHTEKQARLQDVECGEPQLCYRLLGFALDSQIEVSGRGIGAHRRIENEARAPRLACRARETHSVVEVDLAKGLSSSPRP